MTGLNKIIEKIISEANDKAHEIIEQARKRCIEISNEYASRAEKEKNQILESAEKEAEAIIAQSKAEVATDKKNSLLKIRRELVDEAFATARAEIEGLSDEKYCEMITSLASRALCEIIDTQKENLEKYGEEPDFEEYEILLNKKDLDKYQSVVFDEVCKRATARYGTDISKKIRISKKAISIDGGAVVRCGSIENNASLSSLFADLREKLEYEVSKYLFAESGLDS